jgi:hypothetical protein
MDRLVLKPFAPSLEMHGLQFDQLDPRKALRCPNDIPVETRLGVVRSDHTLRRTKVFDVPRAGIDNRQKLGATALTEMTEPLVGSLHSRIETHVLRQFLEVSQRVVNLPSLGLQIEPG